MITVHIAGTNGKGSVAEYISSILMADGKRCGVFTSPHLISPTERMRINGRCIGEPELNALMAEVRHNNRAKNDSLFAAYTAAASLWFKRENVDAIVWETGLGGRLDPTNEVSPDVVVLTSIDIDHTNVLGADIESIAAEKCGIIKTGMPVVSARQHPAVASIIKTHSRRKRAPLTFAIVTHIVSSSINGQVFAYKGNTYTIRAIGSVQPSNAAVAVACAQKLDVCEHAIQKGLARTQLISRMQYIPGNPPMLVDGAHNAASAKALAQTLSQHFAHKPKVLLFACMKDKQVGAMAQALSGHFDYAVLTQADEDRGADIVMLQARFNSINHCITEQDTDVAYKSATALAKSMDALLVICGSFYLTGRILGVISSKPSN